MPIANTIAANVPRDVDHGNFPPVTASQAGVQTVILQLPPSWDYWLWLITDVNGNLTAAMVQEIRLKAKNKPIITISGTALRAQNTFDKVGAGVLTSQILLPAGRFGIGGGANLFDSKKLSLLSGASKDLALLSTLNCGSMGADGTIIDQVSIEIDLINTPAGAISLHCLSLVTPPAAGGPGIIRRIEKKSWNSVIGQNIITRQNFAIGDDQHRFLNRLHFQGIAGNLSAWRIRYNNTDWMIRTPAENLAMQQIFNMRAGSVAQNDFIDFSERGYGDEALFIGDAGTDFQVTYNDSAAELTVVYQDSMGLL